MPDLVHLIHLAELVDLVHLVNIADLVDLVDLVNLADLVQLVNLVDLVDRLRCLVSFFISFAKPVDCLTLFTLSPLELIKKWWTQPTTGNIRKFSNNETFQLFQFWKKSVTKTMRNSEAPKNLSPPFPSLSV